MAALQAEQRRDSIITPPERKTLVEKRAPYTPTEGMGTVVPPPIPPISCVNFSSSVLGTNVTGFMVVVVTVRGRDQFMVVTVRGRNQFMVVTVREGRPCTACYWITRH
jgi:hypothetical protein